MCNAMTGRDFRAELVRIDYPLYKVAAELSMSPTKLWRQLDRRPVPLEVAQGIQAILDRERAGPMPEPSGPNGRT